MARRYYNNVTGTGTLSAPVGTSDTSFTTTGFTATPAVPFTSVVDRGLAGEEVVLVTNVSGGTLTVQRGYDSTSASSHSAGATIEHAIVAEGCNKWDSHVESTSGIHGLSGGFVGTTDIQTVTNKTNQASVYEGQNSTSPGTGPIHKATVDSTSRAGFSADTTGTAAAGKAFQVTQSGADKFLVSADGSVIVAPSGSPTWAEDVTGNVRVTGNETVTGTATIGAAAVTGNETVGGTLGVTGATTLAGLSATTIAGSGNATVGGTLGVTGASTLAGLSATTIAGSGNATVGGTLGITGATTAAGITASGTVAANKLTSTTDITATNCRQTGVIVGGATTVNTSSTSYVSLGSDDVSVTLPYPASGVLAVSIRSAISNNTVGLNNFGFLSFEIRDTNSSGTQRLAASDDYSAFSLSKTANEVLATTSFTRVVTGLPTSGTCFVRAMYRSTSGTTSTFAYRGLSVIPSP